MSIGKRSTFNSHNMLLFTVMAIVSIPSWMHFNLVSSYEEPNITLFIHSMKILDVSKIFICKNEVRIKEYWVSHILTRE